VAQPFAQRQIIPKFRKTAIRAPSLIGCGMLHSLKPIFLRKIQRLQALVAQRLNITVDQAEITVSIKETGGVGRVVLTMT
jgi:hypothetical protein